jgi:hypothetical protein
VFDSECDEELRVRVVVMYECSVVIAVDVSIGVTEYDTSVESIGCAVQSFVSAVGSTVGRTIISSYVTPDVISVRVADYTSFSLSVDDTVSGQYNVRSGGGDRGE